MKTTDRDDNDYLWDGSGEPDPEIVRLEALLGTLRHHGGPPALPARERGRFLTWKIGALAAAAVVVLVSGVAWYMRTARVGVSHAMRCG